MEVGGHVGLPMGKAYGLSLRSRLCFSCFHALVFHYLSVYMSSTTSLFAITLYEVLKMASDCFGVSMMTTENQNTTSTEEGQCASLGQSGPQSDNYGPGTDPAPLCSLLDHYVEKVTCPL